MLVEKWIFGSDTRGTVYWNLLINQQAWDEIYASSLVEWYGITRYDLWSTMEIYITPLSHELTSLWSASRLLKSRKASPLRLIWFIRIRQFHLNVSFLSTILTHSGNPLFMITVRYLLDRFNAEAGNDGALWVIKTAEKRVSIIVICVSIYFYFYQIIPPRWNCPNLWRFSGSRG